VTQRSTQIARHENMSNAQRSEVFTAGILHDIGKLVLATCANERFVLSRKIAGEKNIPLIEAEKEVFGTCHASVGGYLLNLWGLPQPLVELVTFHHKPATTSDTAFSAMTAVMAGNRLCRSEEGFAPDDLEYLNSIGCGEKIAAWKEICLGNEKEVA
jgi:HD-like signal output (HDOD) protein